MGGYMNYLIVLWWTASFLTVIGAYYVGEHKKKGFLFWLVSNPLIMLQTYLTGQYNLVFLYIILMIFAYRGWTKKSKEVTYQEAMWKIFKPKGDSFTVNNPIKKRK